MIAKEARVYDKAKYHYGGQFPPDQTMEQALVHTGMYLGWVIDAGLFNEESPHDSELVNEFKARRLTGAEVYRRCDACLSEDMLNEEGNAFSQFYFDIENGRYLADYEDTLCKELPSLYHVKDTWENYYKMKVIMDARYFEWKRKSKPKSWLFWK